MPGEKTCLGLRSIIVEGSEIILFYIWTFVSGGWESVIYPEGRHMVLIGLKSLGKPTLSPQVWLFWADHQPMNIVKCNSESQREFCHCNDLHMNFISHSWNHST